MISRVVAVLLFAAVLAGASARYTRTVRYDGEIVVRCHKDGPGIASFLQDDFVDVWQYRADGMVDVRVSKKRYDALAPSLQCACTLLIKDIEEYIRRAENVTTAPNAEWFEEYHRYADIVEWYKNLAADHDIVTFDESIGKSNERRDMPAIHITTSSVEDVKTIYSQCQIHAREWISGATCMYLANQLVVNKNEEVKKLLENVKFVFVPFVNPDGYEYTWTKDRLWRKNRRPGDICDGVDLNRNYDDHWNGGGSSGNECSETYHGPAAASEPETKATSEYFMSLKNIVGAIDWHSYSQLILRPYGWTSTDCPDEDQLKALGGKMSDAIKNVHGKVYTSQKSIGLYLTTGTASDWFYSDQANANNNYRAAGYTIELRDTGAYGFKLPPDQIIPTGEEVYQALLVFANELIEKPLNK